MAKELPYFKFEPAEYITKDISFCSYAAQGLFINLCSHYWQRNCEMTLSQAERRFKDKELLKELLDEGVISHVNHKIIIKFLIEQRDEAIEKSKTNKANGSKGGRPRKPKENQKQTENKPNGFNSLSETKGIIKDNIIKDNITTTKEEEEVDFLKVDVWIKEIGKSQMYLEGLYRTHKLYKGSISELLNNFKEHLKIYPKLHNNFSDFKKHFASWLNIKISKGEMSKYLKNTKGQL